MLFTMIMRSYSLDSPNSELVKCVKGHFVECNFYCTKRITIPKCRLPVVPCYSFELRVLYNITTVSLKLNTISLMISLSRLKLVLT